MAVSQNTTLKITAAGSYNLVKTGQAPRSTIFIYGNLGGATAELQGPGGTLEDGAVTTLPFQKVVNHGGIAIQLVITGGTGIALNVRVG